MSTFGSRLAGAGLGALLVIGIGGAGLAYAQTAEETPSTTARPPPAPTPRLPMPGPPPTRTAPRRALVALVAAVAVASAAGPVRTGPGPEPDAVHRPVDGGRRRRLINPPAQMTARGRAEGALPGRPELPRWAQPGRVDERKVLIDILERVDGDLVAPPRPELAGLVHWGGGGALPIHRWFRYREGFSPALIRSVRLGQRILDPFCGSGSIMIGAAQQGRSSVGIDVNPLAAFVARVKLSPLSEHDVAAARRLPDRVRGRPCR